MEKVTNFYLAVNASLKNLQTERLSREKLLPLKIVLSKEKKISWKNKRLIKKNEKLRKQIEDGYYKGIKDSLKSMNQIYEEFLQMCQEN